MAKFGFGGTTPLPDAMGPEAAYRVQHSDYAQMQPGLYPQAGPQQPSQKLGLGDWLDVLLFDGELGQGIDRARARKENPERLAQSQKLRQDVLGNDPRAMLAYLTDPKAWAGETAKNFAPQNVAGGNTLVRPGFGATTAPKYEMSGDSGVQLGPQGMKVLGQRPTSAAEEATMADRETQRLIQMMLAKSTVQDRAARQGVAQQRANQAGARPSPSSGFSSGRSLGSSLPSDRY